MNKCPLTLPFQNCPLPSSDHHPILHIVRICPSFKSAICPNLFIVQNFPSSTSVYYPKREFSTSKTVHGLHLFIIQNANFPHLFIIQNSPWSASFQYPKRGFSTSYHHPKLPIVRICSLFKTAIFQNLDFQMLHLAQKNHLDNQATKIHAASPRIRVSQIAKL